jgi:hypothetical protein
MTNDSSGVQHSAEPGAALTVLDSRASAGHLHAGLLHEALIVCDGAPGGQVVRVADAVQQLLLPVWQCFLPLLQHPMAPVSKALGGYSRRPCDTVC